MSTPDFTTAQGQADNARKVRDRLMNPPAAYVPAPPKPLPHKPAAPVGPFAPPGEAWAEILPEKTDPPLAETILSETASLLETSSDKLLIDTSAAAGMARVFAAALLMLSAGLTAKAAATSLGVDPGTASIAVSALRELARARLAPLLAPAAILVPLLWQPFRRHCEASALLSAKPRLFAKDIASAVANRFGIRIEDMLSQRRTASVTVPRQLAMSLAKRLTPMSYPEIARHIGGRDHTTAMHACRKYEPMLATIAAELDADASLQNWIDRAFMLMQDKKWNGRGA